jgi:DUF1680 family protein
MKRISRRGLMTGGAVLAALSSPAVAATKTAAAKPARAEPFPLEAVTLTPSIWQSAVTRNGEYLKSLEPDRFLHNFRTSAGLEPKGKVYGGWEAMGIAGHCLGHYLTACSLAYAQTRDPVFKQRVDYTIGEMALIQARHGDGYIGGTTVKRDGKEVDGKIVFEEVRAHKISTHGFDVNGGWVPLYTWHKVHAGLLDVHRYANNAQALDVTVKMSDYLIGVLGGLNDDELQQLLAAEHGGLNETFTETYVRTGQKRFLDMGQRIYHKAILVPLSEGRDELDGKHANTQIPKIIGLARLYEVTGDTGYRDTAAFFWERVVDHHSYVIGGNADSEHFGKADAISPHITDKTCEACNSYNMLKLTRHLYADAPDAKWFDFYERTHLNHIMAHQDPQTGLFVYFMPLNAGSARVYSTPTESFWCCVGSGMESHAKHGDSIYWRSGDTAFVNLYIPSQLNWTAQKTTLRLDSKFPEGETVTLHVDPQAPRTFELALRLPAWCAKPRLSINGQAQAILPKAGYARLRRTWKKGDVVTLTLPQTIRAESPPDNPRIVAYLKGPMVLAADMGPAAVNPAPQNPVLIGTDAMAVLDPVGPTLNAQPQAVNLTPFYAQYNSRSNVYFPLFTEAQWQAERASYEAAQAAELQLNIRTVDVIRLGEQQPETDHGFETDASEVTSRLGRAGRYLLWTPSHTMAFDLKVDPQTTALQVTYWGEDINRSFEIYADDQLLLVEHLKLPRQASFRAIEYPLPAALLKGKSKVRVRFTTQESALVVFECRTLRAAPVQKA